MSTFKALLGLFFAWFLTSCVLDGAPETITYVLHRSVTLYVRFQPGSNERGVSPELVAAERMAGLARFTSTDATGFREHMAKFTAAPRRPLKGTEVSTLTVGQAKAILVVAPGVSNTPSTRTILHFHGGGYVGGEALAEFCSVISQIARARVLSVNYRLAPEYPLPAAVDDGLAAFNYLTRDLKVDPKNIVVMGESAGGGLGLLLLQRLRDDKSALPAGAAVSSPWTDLSCSGKSYQTNANTDAILSHESLIPVAREVTRLPQTDSLVSPLFANWEGLPPMLITAAKGEVLLDDSVKAAAAAEKAGVDVSLEIEDTVLHCYQLFHFLSPETSHAIARYAGFARQLLDRPSSM